MLKNLQSPEKRDTRDGTVLSVNSIFHTIQGEGPFAGRPSVFVRLAGCNLQCPLCDTQYTDRTELDVDSLIRGILNSTPHGGMPSLVVITGGEPFRQKLTPFVNALLHGGIIVQVETNGSYFEDGFPYALTTIVCSPKAGVINRKLMPHIRALKYVASVDSLVGSPDGLPTHALEHPNGGMLARPDNSFVGEIYLQPVDEQDEQANRLNQEAVVNSCLENGYRLCLQMHKIVGVD